jgi:tetratricopeptide (TPR) repeat protein
LTIHDIRRRFEVSTDFNEIFEAFEHALRQRLDDIELYRHLFWNHSLSPDELTLFGEKLAQEFGHLAYDVYMWLAGVFEATTAANDNYELAVEYYRKAARAQPAHVEPYLYAADCFEPDLNIPPVAVLINFLKEGTHNVAVPRLLYQRLAHLYETVGNDEMTAFCRRKAQEGSGPPQDAPPEL